MTSVPAYVISREIGARMAYLGIKSVQALADISGLKYDTLRARLAHPEKFKLEELRTLQKVLGMDVSPVTRYLGVKEKK